MEALDDVLVSRANVKQRRGRAGRCRPGVAFHLLTKHCHETICEVSQQPEIRRVPLERLILTIKALGYVPPAAAICARLLEPPDEAAVKQAVASLAGMDALDLAGGEEALTALGAHLVSLNLLIHFLLECGSSSLLIRSVWLQSCLPTDARIGKFILLGAIFGVVDETLTIASTLSHRSPFMAPFDKREQADEAKRLFATGQSDHLAVLNAYMAFDRMGPAKYEFARENFLGIKTMQMIGGLKRQLLELLSDAGFVPKGLRAQTVEAMGRRAGGCDGVAIALSRGLHAAAPAADESDAEKGARGPGSALGSKDELLKALLCAALYPQIAAVESKDDKGGNGAKGGKGGSPPKVVIREAGEKEPVAVAIHPSSVNARASSLSGGPPQQLLPPVLKGQSGSAIVDIVPGEGAETVLTVDGWIKFRIPTRARALIIDTRAQLTSLLQQKIASPEIELSSAGKGILAAVTALLDTPPPYRHPNAQ
ncbi:MAG: hypothetical protein SGPRY_006303 [Prymnesium sp.]